MILKDIMKIVSVKDTDEINVRLAGEHMVILCPKEIPYLNCFMNREVIGIFGYNANGYNGLAIDLK